MSYNPYPYWAPYLYYPYWSLPLIDPLALMSYWMYMWTYYITALYYIEMYKVMVEAWKKYMESMAEAFKPPT